MTFFYRYFVQSLVFECLLFWDFFNGFLAWLVSNRDFVFCGEYKVCILKVLGIFFHFLKKQTERKWELNKLFLWYMSLLFNGISLMCFEFGSIFKHTNHVFLLPLLPKSSASSCSSSWFKSIFGSTCLYYCPYVPGFWKSLSHRN